MILAFFRSSSHEVRDNCDVFTLAAEIVAASTHLEVAVKAPLLPVGVTNEPVLNHFTFCVRFLAVADN